MPFIITIIGSVVTAMLITHHIFSIKLHILYSLLILLFYRAACQIIFSYLSVDDFVTCIAWLISYVVLMIVVYAMRHYNLWFELSNKPQK